MENDEMQRYVPLTPSPDEEIRNIDSGNRNIESEIIKRYDEKTKDLYEKISELERDLKDPKSLADMILKFKTVFAIISAIVVFALSFGLGAYAIYYNGRYISFTEKTDIKIEKEVKSLEDKLLSHNININEKFAHIESLQKLTISEEVNKLKNNK